MSTRTVAYLRVSTAQQADHGVSLAAQRAKAEAYASLYELDLVEIIEDTASGKALNRDGLTRALGMLEAGEADALLVVKLDRLTRSVRDLHTLLDGYFRSRFTLMSVSEHLDTGSANGRLFLGIMAEISQWEREVIAERTREALAHKRSRGERVGGIPYGKRLAADGVRLIPDEAEQDVLTACARARADGLSLRAIARELDRQGFASRSGRSFAANQIRRMLAA